MTAKNTPISSFERRGTKTQTSAVQDLNIKNINNIFLTQTSFN
jgi:hypothetical protein